MEINSTRTRTAEILFGRVVERIDAFPTFGVIHAHGKLPVLHGQAVGAGICTKIGVKGAVFLHDDHNVFHRCTCKKLRHKN